MIRVDGRKPEELRSVIIEPEYVIYPEGSVLISIGNTVVLCNVSIEERVPHWFQEQDMPGGWITAEYGLLPRSTHTRTNRETHGLSGRSQEIRRLIGRSLRAAFNLSKLGERTFIVDCDVIQADGGTRTASITGGYVALRLALNKLIDVGNIKTDVFNSPIAAVSVGIVKGLPLLDLSYEEDSMADVDLNIVMNSQMEFIEIQGTAEGKSFSRDSLDQVLDLASIGIEELLMIQNQAYQNK